MNCRQGARKVTRKIAHRRLTLERKGENTSRMLIKVVESDKRARKMFIKEMKSTGNHNTYTKQSIHLSWLQDITSLCSQAPS